MLSKILEKRIKITSQEMKDNSGNPLEIEYYLVESDSGNEEGSMTEKEYGVEIIKKENGNIMESAIFKRIFCNKERTENLLEKLAVNTVTPLSLNYILDDMIGI